MTDRDALLAAIHDAPDDDAPRLVFADWLDENGHPERAEFIRLQVEMRRERTENPRITRRLDELFVRQRALFQQDWARPAREFGVKVIGYYSRGFAPAEFHLRPDEFVRHAPTLASWFGPGSRVVLVQVAGDLARAGGRPELAAVRNLTVRFGDTVVAEVAAADLAEFGRSPYLGGLRALDFSHQNLTRRLVDALCDAEALTNLEHLILAGNRLNTAAFLRLAGNRRFANLRVLEIQDTGASDPGVKALLESPHLRRLERLVAGGYGLTARFLDRLPPDRRAVLGLVADD